MEIRTKDDVIKELIRISKLKNVLPSNDRSWITSAVSFLKHSPKNPSLRVMSRDEVINGCGIGWIESWFDADYDPADPMPERYYIEPVAFIEGYAIKNDGDLYYIPHEDYNIKKPGMCSIRIWTKLPSEEIARATPWDGEDIK